MKKLIAALLALVMVFSLAACGDKPDNTQTPDEGGSVVTPTENQEEVQPTESEDEQANLPMTDGLTVDVLRNYPETPASQFVYEECFEGTGMRIVSYEGNDDVVVIPAEIDGLPVLDIAVYCFGNESTVRGVLIPESVKSLDEVFNNNDDLELVIAEGLETLGYALFNYCTNLREVVLGDNVTCIEECAFGTCSSLEKLSIPASLTELSEEAIFTCFVMNKTMTISCEAGSYIEQVAIDYNIPYVNE